MQAVVLVGGFGTRLRPLTETIPKQLLPVAGTPMIERVLAALAVHGVERAVLSMGYLPDPFVAAYPSRRVAGVAVDFAVEPSPLDTAGAISFAAQAIGIDETFLAVNGDVLTDLDVSALIARHRALGAEGTVHLTPVEDPSRFGVVVVDDRGLVTDWVEKPDAGSAPSNLINAGTYVLEPSFVARVPRDVATSIEQEVFPAMIAERRLFGMVDDSYWLDAGTPGSYLRANTDVLDGKRTCEVPGERADSTLRLSGAVVASTSTTRRTVIGHRSRVGEGACVEGSVLLDDVVIGEGATVLDSVIGPRASVGARARLAANCIVAEGVHVPDGAQLGGAGVAT